jgi:hypothetical protein
MLSYSDSIPGSVAKQGCRPKHLLGVIELGVPKKSNSVRIRRLIGRSRGAVATIEVRAK